MKKIFFTLSFLLLTATAYCAPRSLQQMKAAAAGVLKTDGGVSTRSGAGQIKLLKNGKQFTILGYDTGGFAVIANDDMFDAVLGYSDTRFNQDNIPPAMQWWMDAIDKSLQAKLATGEVQADVETLESSDYPARVDKLLTCRWGQDAPYNDMTPTYSVSGIGGSTREHYVTGCVATAMAQIMYFHKWPDTGEGMKFYDFTANDGTLFELEARFNRTHYDWDNMIDDYSGVYNGMQAEAVAQLMLHCGISVEMMYNIDGSGAYTTDATTAMRDYFRYSTKIYQRDIYTTNDWMNIIREEISNRRPILYGGSSLSQGGHAFVLDGYDENGLVHINWGWNGKSNGFYEVGEMLTFSENQDMIIAHGPDAPEIPYSSQFGIMPSISWTGGQTTRGSFTVTAYGNMLSFTVTSVLNCDAESFSGNLALLAEPVDGGTQTTLWSMPITGFTENSGYPEISQGEISTASLPDGTYQVYLATKSSKETDWQTVRSNEHIVNSYEVTIAGGVPTVGEGTPGWTTGIEAVNVAGDGMVRVYTADGVLVYTAAADAFSIDDVPATGLLIVKNGAKTTKVVK